MSIQLAKDEKVVKAFDYATVGYNRKLAKYTTYKSLIVTNKRVVHEAVCETRGNEVILRQEMPVTDAKYVNTTMGKTSTPAFLVLTVIFAILAAVAYVLPMFVLPNLKMILTLVAAACGLLAVIFLVAFIVSHKAMVVCSISTDHPICPAIGFASIESELTSDVSDKKKKKSKKPTIEIRVNRAAAKDLANELGAAILNAIAYDPNEEIAPEAEETEVEAEAETASESVEAAAEAEETPAQETPAQEPAADPEA